MGALTTNRLNHSVLSIIPFTVFFSLNCACASAFVGWGGWIAVTNMISSYHNQAKRFDCKPCYKLPHFLLLQACLNSIAPPQIRSNQNRNHRPQMGNFNIYLISCNNFQKLYPIVVLSLSKN